MLAPSLPGSISGLIMGLFFKRTISRDEACNCAKITLNNATNDKFLIIFLALSMRGMF